ncbi:unnamed protein product [Heterobilharzia americana]|nr:unnamed protein product [Heterobilharzia americana]
MTYDGQLRVIRPLNVDIITEHNITRPYLPTNIINFDIIAVDDAGIAYSKTGYATIQLQVENIDDEAPEIKIHPIQSIQKNFLSTNHQLYETEIEVLENQPPNQLIALIEVKDPDCISYSISQCILTGVNAIDFRLSYQHSMNNEYRLYTVTKLDREKQSNILLSIECKDLTNHITSNNIIIHILDTNDHAPKCSEQLYHFALYEDDNELDHLDINLLNRSWFTSNQLAFISVNDEDIGINAEITYYIPIEFEEKLNGKISIDSKTGQLFAWGPFDREQISIYEFIVIATDSGQPIKFSTNCSVIVKILDINDNPPLFHTQLSITGGYLFSIHENQLPGTRVGQIQAYDLDLLPATTHITDLFTHLEKSDLYIPNEMNTIVNNIDKRLVYSLKNELNSQAFRIDPKTGVIITRTILDREIQSTYTFYAYVHDGPDQSNQTSSITTEKSKIQATKGNNGYNQDIVSHHRSHTASIMITITIQDENDNDPVFIRPNSTNHMILLNPSAIPGQSLSQLLATDPDEGLNGQVTYAIKGETAGTLFNVDPRTGLLYLESQIPRQYISNTRRMADNNNHNHNNNNDNNQNQANDLLEVSTYPTFLLALDACDQGEPKRCTHFPNLQIQIRSSSNIIDEVKSSHLQDSSLLSKSNTGTISLASSSSSSSLGSGVTNFFRINSGIINPYLGKYSLVEILIIGFSIFFSLLILIILFIVFIIRRRTQQLLQNNEQINPELLKLNHSNSGFNVELHEKRKEMNNRTRKICNWNFSRSIPQQLNSMMTINTSDNNTNSMQPINCNQPVDVHPLTLSTLSSNSQMFNQKEMTYQLDVSDSCILNSNKHHAIHYNQYNPIFINSTNNKQVVSDDYQSLDCWNDITTNYPKKFIQSNLSKSSNLNLPPFYMRELKQPIIGNNSNVNFTNNIPYTYYQQKDTFDSDWKSNKTSYITSHNDMNNTHNSISNENITICTTNNNNSQHNIISKNKENIHTYTGYLKSSFV